MSHYLPTISVLIDTNSIPKGIKENVEIQDNFLGELHEKAPLYMCTSRNWQHLEAIRRVAEYLGLFHLDFLDKECEIINLEETHNVLKALKIFENLILDNTRLRAYLLADMKADFEQIKTNYSEKNSKVPLDALKAYNNEQSNIINEINYTKIYQECHILEQISDDNLYQMHKKHYHDFITVLYWLKTHIGITEKAIKEEKNILYISIFP